MSTVEPPPIMRDGLLWWSSPRATVGLVVRGGMVADCPPYAARWAFGRDARDLWEISEQRGVWLAWLPDAEPDEEWTK